MKTTLINGIELQAQLLDNLYRRVTKLERAPGLAIFLIGENPESTLYVSLKEKAALKAGIDVHVYRFADDTRQEDIVRAIEFINEDETTDGIIVQWPLPEHYDVQAIFGAIDPDKDADGFLERNRAMVLAGAPYVLPVLVRVVQKIIDMTKLVLSGKSVVLISDNQVFSEPMSHLLREAGAHVHTLLPQDASFHDRIAEADLIVSAIGKPNTVRRDDVKEGVALIDIGFTKQQDGIHGDIDPNVDGVALWRTPVPGGVGPLTVAFLLENVYELNKKRTA